MPNETEEICKQMAENGTKLSDEIFNEKHGTYKETGTWTKSGSQESSASKHDPSPLTNIKK
jgi:hypothetical protein